MEITLQDTERRYQALFEQYNDAFYIVDLDGVYLDVNQKGADLLGYEVDELVGMHIKQTLPPREHPDFEYNWKIMFAGEPLPIFQRILRKKNGTEIPVEINAILVRDETGNFVYIQSIVRDIRERERLERSLKDTERRYQALFDRSNDAVFIIGLNQLHLVVNHKAANLLGYEIDELIGMPIKRIIAPYEYKNSLQILDQLHSGEVIPIYERIFRKKDGTEIPVEINATLVYDENESPLYIQSIVRDISKRKGIEEALRTSETRYRHLFEDSPISLREEDFSKISDYFKGLQRSGVMNFREYFENHPEAVINCATRVEILDVNQATLDLYKAQSKEQILGNLDRLFSDESYNVFKEELIALAEGQTHFKCDNIANTLTGDKIYTNIRLSISPGYEKTLSKVLVSSLDITKQKQAEETLQIKNNAIESSITAFAIANLEGKLTYVNPAFLKLWGYENKIEILGRLEKEFWFDIGHVMDIIEIIQSKKYWVGERTAKKKDGSLFEAQLSISMVTDKTGQPISRLTTVVDITSQIQAEVALAKVQESLAEEVAERTLDLAEEKLRIETIIETIPDGILVLDPKGWLSLANKTFVNLYQQVFQDELPHDFNIYEFPTSNLGVEIIKLITSKELQPTMIEPIKGLHLQLQAAHISLANQIHPLGTIIEFRDVTGFVELDNLKNQFVSMVSHELRTPITAISLAINTFQKYRKEMTEAQQQEMIITMGQSSKLLVQMIEDLLIISRIEERKITLEWILYWPEKVFREIVSQLEPNWTAKQITIQLQISPLIKLNGDPQRISQIFRILIENAIKYSPKKSSIQITAIDHYHGKYNPKKIDGLLIQVVDTGQGIRTQDLPYLFERFYRADDVKHIQGSGLGLAIAQELVSLHKGQIHVESVYGKGSTFAVFLPRIAQPKKTSLNLSGKSL